MTSAADLAALAALLADPTRAAICLALLDGRAWTATELAAHAGVARSTTTEHLHRLVSAGLLAEHRQGRHRYVRLASPAVAQLLEDLTAHVGPRRTPPRGLRQAGADAALRRARTCYDHLAGRLGVLVTDAMTAAGLLDPTGGLGLTPDGRTWLTDRLGVAEDTLRAGSRPLVRACLDWTERRPHLAGLAGAAICDTFFRNAWITRIGSGRAVRLTPAGAHAVRGLLGVADPEG